MESKRIHGAVAITASALAIVLATAIAQGPVAHAQTQAEIDAGKALTFDRRKGNCMSCHMIPGATLPGNIGPPLIGMKARWPDRAKLRAQVWDATASNPQSMMPPFGRHGVLTEQEIDRVVDFIQTL